MPNHKAAILLSRQSMRPSGITPWIKNTFEALRWIKENNYTLVLSTGMQTWEMTTAVASDLNINQIIYVPCEDEQNYSNQKETIIEEFELDINKTEFIPVISEHGINHLHLRDELVLNNADVLIPVSIRTGGFMKSYLEANIRKKTIIDKFEIKYQKRSEPLKYNISKNKINPLLNEIGKTYLTHWTRTANYNWPDETKSTYWRDIVSSNEYPRGAVNTLCHILSTGIIVSSMRHMPLNAKTVSFTDLPALKALSLMKWRARYREMSFEPYGIAIEKKWGIENGIKAVKYYDPSFNKMLIKSERWYSQSKGEKTDWRNEQEYRYKNDFQLSQVPKDKLLVFCYKPEEILKIGNESRAKILPIKSY